MWRFGYDEVDLGLAKRLLPAVEHGIGIPVFPAWETSWHFEDKITQGYLLEAAGIPAPETWTFWKEHDALEFCRSAEYPFVAKLSAGIRSNNVMLVHDRAQAERLVHQMFGAGVHTFHPPKLSLRARIGRTRAVRALRGRPVEHPRRHAGYFYAQEFLPGNAFDTRVTVIGNRAFAFRRFNREGDFRASGSGKISWEPSEIDLPTVQLAFEVAKKLETQSVAIDGMMRGSTRLVGEISYTYAAWAIEKCPGHWTEDASGDLRWVEGQVRAEDAIFDDFVSGIGAPG
jgi:glutathione synthase/RimK-type ligase-like ATP-grasp enzyme